ncbi:hypothetical protein [Thioalkalivibrio sp. HK1]|uniref:hypothetical protein n=1 Tax=Thioalkalivibrio sp. HK1 TaxID=1469245 RepID=UPI0012DDCFA8|nr:hypothetical protein [Thioalkalivibrio sp. HK1]
MAVDLGAATDMGRSTVDNYIAEMIVEAQRSRICANGFEKSENAHRPNRGSSLATTSCRGLLRECRTSP